MKIQRQFLLDLEFRKARIEYAGIRHENAYPVFLQAFIESKMKHKNIYQRLARHLSLLGMGYPPNDDLVEILEANFTREEAELAMAVPSGVIPLQTAPVDEIAAGSDLPKPDLEKMLEGLADRGLLFSGTTGKGEKGYALQQVGFSFPQTFFWKGRDTPHARNMAGLIAKYFNRKVTEKAYSSGTHAYRYIPLQGTVGFKGQAVIPHHTMDSVIDRAREFAVCHCSCRMIAGLRGRPCGHPTEVCLKFDEVARYVVQRGLGREIDRESARELVKQAEDAGLVHFVDNAEEGIKHNCNCCGCACWNVGAIRRRKIPRDILMAVYFARETDAGKCVGCGECAGMCPVEAVTMDEDLPVVDMDWCIGCGVCATSCPEEAISLTFRADKAGAAPAESFSGLHEKILKEKGLG